MKRVLANDGIAADGKALLEAAGFEVVTDKVEQEDLAAAVGAYDALVVRSATKVRAKDVEQPGNLKLVVRAGVGIDNIEVAAVEAKGIQVNNTPNSSTQSVAELAMAHMYGVARYIHESNQKMPLEGSTNFKELKKKFEKGFELNGKTLGIIGFGRIGQQLAKLAMSVGMQVVAYNRTPKEVELVFDHLPFAESPKMKVSTVSLDEVLQKADMISLHVPGGDKPLIGAEEIVKMKDGVVVINTARGDSIDEAALMAGVKSGKIGFAGIDVYENEPNINTEMVGMHNVSLTPHIGAATKEAQARVSKEVAQLIIDTLG